MNSEPIISVRTYVVVWVSLLILTLTTTGVAFIDLGGRMEHVNGGRHRGRENSFGGACTSCICAIAAASPGFLPGRDFSGC